MKKSKKILLLFAFILGNFSVLAHLFFQNPSISKPQMEKVSSYPKEYVYEPTYSTDLIQQATISYPFVKTPPWDLKYPLLTFREEFHLGTKRFDELFFAEKRIAEILLWGNQLPIEHSIKNGGAEVLAKWWRSQTVNSYNSWEASFARYLLHVENRFEELHSLPTQQNQNSERIYLATHIKGHFYDVERTIKQSTKSKNVKKYLMDLNRSIYNYLYTKALENVSTANEHRITLPLTKPLHEKEFGTYSLHLYNMPQVWESSDDVTLRFGAQSYNIHGTSNGFSSNDLSVMPSLFRNSSEKIVISYPEVNLVDQLVWTWNAKKREYSAEVKPNGFDKYLFDLKSQLEEPYVVKIIETKRANIRGKFVYDDTELLNEEVLPQSSLVEKNWIITSSSKNKDFVLTIKILPLRKRSVIDPYSISSIKLIPIPEPLVQLKKESSIEEGRKIEIKRQNQYTFKLVKQNLSSSEKEYLKSHYNNWALEDKEDTLIFTFKPYQNALKLLIIFNSLFLFLAILVFLKRGGGRLISLLNILRYLSIKLRYPLFFIFISGLIFDLLILNDYSSIVFLSLTFIWIFVVIGLKLQALSGFNLTLFFLMAVPFFAYFGKEGVAEKFAIWGINFAIISSVQLLLFIDHQSSNAPRSFTVMRMVKAPFIFILSAFLRLLKKSMKLLGTIILGIFNQRPKTMKDYLLNAVKALLLVILAFFITTSISVILLRINKEINAKKELEVQYSNHPKISLFEPRIVYFSTKVLIKGNNFGWKQHDKVKLVKDGEIVSTDLWTNNKIIFTIPLHWKEGNSNIWVEKKVRWKGKTYTAKSNRVMLKIIPRSNTFTPADDEYFNQLKYLDKETLLLNGYR